MRPAWSFCRRRRRRRPSSISLALRSLVLVPLLLGFARKSHTLTHASLLKETRGIDSAGSHYVANKPEGAGA